jgi:hypothetical protein
MLKCDPGKYVEHGEIILLGFVCQVTFFSCAIQLKFFSIDKFGFEYSLGLGLGSVGGFFSVAMVFLTINLKIGFSKKLS